MPETLQNSTKSSRFTDDPKGPTENHIHIQIQKREDAHRLNGVLWTVTNKFARMWYSGSILLALTAGCLPAEAQVPIPVSDLDGPPAYRALVEAGDAALEEGDHRTAEAKYRDALSVPIHEVPNYEVYLRLALVEQRRENWSSCNKILTDFECMLDVEIGRRPCFGEAAPGYLGARNPEVSEECAQRMCGEIYLSYYENPTDAVKERVESLRRQAQLVRNNCAQDPETKE